LPEMIHFILEKGGVTKRVEVSGKKAPIIGKPG